MINVKDKVWGVEMSGIKLMSTSQAVRKRIAMYVGKEDRVLNTIRHVLNLARGLMGVCCSGGV